MPGTFITFEGGEGSGKSTQIKLLAERLKAAKVPVLVTREPGGTPGAEAIRKLLVSGEVDSWSPTAEALLNYAARESHLRDSIRLALDKKHVVLCDRFMDSTRAYQGYAGGCDMNLLDQLERHIVGVTRPSVTLILDIDPELGLARAKGRHGARHEDRFERKSLEFHRCLRQGFREIAKLEPERCKLIDASRSVEAIAKEVWTHVAGLMGNG